ncbi:hypothetical protein [Stutzerimonas balearica]|uniref:hypothetical protein n=1 Tax=Stutzerimonas balearica TaxID=74829 RepID=UPI0028AF2FD2|nr:hypothetical protein [Stutzerimonas balearica]
MNSVLQFLHNPKTGGIAIKYALAAYANELAGHIQFHGHKTRLADISGGSLGFVVRDPVSRFVSAFYYRKRQGKPRYQSAWNAVECEVFTAFDTPRQLAETLGDVNSAEHSLALEAMNGIGHLRKLGYWLGDAEYLSTRLQDLLFVLVSKERSQKNSIGLRRFWGYLPNYHCLRMRYWPTGILKGLITLCLKKQLVPSIPGIRKITN